MTTKVTSPKGIAKYPALIRPDTRYNKEGTYKTGLIVPEDSIDELRDACVDEFVSEFGKAKLAKATMPFRPVEDEEGNPTGEYELTFKSKNRPKFFDAKGNPITNIRLIEKLGGGSKLRIKGAAKAYNNGGKLGVTLYLNEVQVVKYVEYNGGGFKADDDEEDGFEVSASENSEGSETPPWDDSEKPQKRPSKDADDSEDDEDIDF